MKIAVSKIQFVSFSFFLFCAVSIFAQTGHNYSGAEAGKTAEKTYTVTLTARAYGDSIVLRWAPEDAGVWGLANKYGWYLTRTGGNTSGQVLLNSAKPIKPWDESMLRSTFGGSDNNAGLLAQLLYSQSAVSRTLADNPSTLYEYIYRQHGEQSRRQMLVYMLADQNLCYAKAAGLCYVDKDVERGVSYEYTLVIADDMEADGNHGADGLKGFISIPQASIIVNNKTFKKSDMPEVPQASITRIDDYRVAINWPASTYAGYYVERQNQSDSTWQQVNHAPIMKLQSNQLHSTKGGELDSLVINNVVCVDSIKPGETATYRMRAFDVFGDYTDWVVLPAYKMPQIQHLERPVLYNIVADSNSTHIEWLVNKDASYKGFVVAFASSLSDKWTKVSDKLGDSIHVFNDTLANTRGVGYYRVYAYDSIGNVSCSNILPNAVQDTQSVTSPQMLRGRASMIKTESNGSMANTSLANIALKWNEVKAKDVIGYRIYASADRNKPFYEAAPAMVSQSIYNDTVTIQSDTLYYYIVAVDGRHNYSVPSDTIAVDMPDVVSPEPCSLISAVELNDRTVVRWAKSTSADVVKYHIYSQCIGTSNWQWIATIKAEDIDTVEFVQYSVQHSSVAFPTQYVIEAVDHSGNVSPRGGIVEVKPTNGQPVEFVTALTASRNKKRASVKLDWKYAAPVQPGFYGVIYRSVDGSKPVAVGMAQPTQTSFTDAKLPQEGRMATYYIVVKSSNGVSTSPSQSVNVSLR